MAGFSVVLDACVLVPVSLADTLLRIAEYDVYRPVWSSRILAEVRGAILRVHPDLDAGRVDARLHAMDAAFEDACVNGWEALEPGIRLPDPGDRHVVAAALCGRAQAIVTHNVADFPAKPLEDLGLHALSPDDFLLDALDLAPDVVGRVIVEQAADARRPPLAVEEVLESLRRAGAPRFARALTDTVS